MKKRVAPIPPTWLTQARIAQGWPMSQIDALSHRALRPRRGRSAGSAGGIGQAIRYFGGRPDVEDFRAAAPIPGQGARKREALQLSA